MLVTKYVLHNAILFDLNGFSCGKPEIDVELKSSIPIFYAIVTAFRIGRAETIVNTLPG